MIDKYGGEDDDSSLTGPALKEMIYMDAVLNETLRLVPPIGGGFRRVLSDFELDVSAEEGGRGAVTIPKGAKLFYGIGATHLTNPSTDSNFLPARWLSSPHGKAGGSSAVDGTLAGGFCPFAAGRRTCLGMPLARLEAKIFGALVVRMLDVRLENPGVAWGHFPIPKPGDGLPIMAKFREGYAQ